MRSSRIKTGIGFFILWVVMAVLGWTARRLLLSFYDIALIGQYYMASFLGNGLLIGLLQWIVLYRHLGARGWPGSRSGFVWVSLSGIGWIMAWGFNILFPTLFILAAEFGYSLFSISLLAGGVSALFVGLLQSRIIEKYIGNGRPWIPTLMLSMIAAMLMHQSIPMLYPTAASMLAGLVFGLISGIGMMMLLQDNQVDAHLPEIFEPVAKYISPDFR